LYEFGDFSRSAEGMPKLPGDWAFFRQEQTSTPRKKKATETPFGATLFPCRSWVKEPRERRLFLIFEGAFAVVGPQGALI
jgi:hypothetical protein